MAQDYTNEAQAVADALNAVYENKQTNKKNNISGDYSSDNASYPTVKAVKDAYGSKKTSWASTPSDSDIPSEKLVKDSLDGKSDIGHTHDYASSNHNHDNTYVKKAQGSSNATKNVVTDSSGNISFVDMDDIPTKTSDLTNDGADGTNAFVSTNDSRLSDARTPTSHTHGNLSNDGKIGSASGKIITTGTGGLIQASDSISKSMISDFPSSMTPTSHTHGNITNDGKIGSTSGLPVITGTGGAVTTGSFGTTSGTFAEGNHTHSQYLTAHQSLSDIGGEVTVEKQTTAETGYTATYVVKQNNVQVGSKINIPKDFLVKSGEVKTVANGDLSTLGNGYSVGDKYIDFVINTKDNTGTDEHIYINVKDLVEDTTYSADNSTLQLSNTTFSIKNKGVTATQIADKTITATQIADSVVAKNITQTDITNWNDMVSGGLTTTDVQSEISAFANALAEAINPST